MCVGGRREMKKEPKKARKKSTFDLDPELHRRLKVHAAQQGVDMLDIVSRAIDFYLKFNSL
jgi:predicted HicB family RNase H-like nuclease